MEKKGDFELAVPLATGGIAHYTRNNDTDDLSWNGPIKFGIAAGLIKGVSIIQSKHLELLALTDGQLAFFWRDSGPDFSWIGPQYLNL